MDRAGLVGADGATHCGAFDVTYMACVPNMVVMAPSNEAELINMVATAAAIDDRPSCFRFPRGNGLGLDLAEYGISPDLKGRPLEVGKGLVVREGSDVALVGYGSMVQSCLAAAAMLEKAGVSATVVDARYVGALMHPAHSGVAVVGCGAPFCCNLCVHARHHRVMIMSRTLSS